MVFVDTSAWFAKFVPDDPNHAQVQAWFDETGEVLVTTDYCIDATLTLLEQFHFRCGGSRSAENSFDTRVR